MGREVFGTGIRGRVFIDRPVPHGHRPLSTWLQVKQDEAMERIRQIRRRAPMGSAFDVAAERNDAMNRRRRGWTALAGQYRVYLKDVHGLEEMATRIELLALRQYLRDRDLAP